MSITLKVPSIACQVCATTITKAIQNSEPDAQVTVDVSNKVVTVETQASEAKIKEIIVNAGHQPE